MPTSISAYLPGDLIYVVPGRQGHVRTYLVLDNGGLQEIFGPPGNMSDELTRPDITKINSVRPPVANANHRRG